MWHFYTHRRHIGAWKGEDCQSRGRISEQPMAVSEILRSSRKSRASVTPRKPVDLMAAMTMYRGVGRGILRDPRQWPKCRAVSSAGGRGDISVSRLRGSSPWVNTVTTSDQP